MQVTDIGHNRRTLIILSLVCVFLHLAISPGIAISNGHPNFMLILAGSVALWLGGSTGVAFGFCSGLFFDLTTTGPVGLMAFLMCISSWLVGYSGRNRFAEGWAVPSLYFLAQNAAVSALYALAMILVGQASSPFETILYRAVPSIFLTSLFFLPFLLFLSGRPGGSKGIGRNTPSTFGRSQAPRLRMNG